MRPFNELKNWITALVKGEKVQSEAELEMQHHLELLEKEYIEEGMKPEEARKAAFRKFGNCESFHEECQESWGVRLFNDLIADVRFAWRQMLKNKTSTLVIISTLAICIGANSTASNLVMRLVTNPYEYQDEKRIVLVGKMWGKHNRTNVSQIAIPHYLYFKEHADWFSEIGFVDDETDYDLEFGDNLQRITIDEITGEIWDIVGVRPIQGRMFNQAEVDAGNESVIVLSESLWVSLGGVENDLIGESILLNNRSYEIIGVAPSSFYLGINRSQAWIPRIFRPWEIKDGQRNNHSYMCMAKLRPGVSLELAKLNLKNLYNQFLEKFPEDKDDQKRTGASFGAVAIEESLFQNIGQIEIAFKSIQMVTLVVLIIGCLNVGGMLMVKGYTRSHELATRRAMGASIGRLSRQLLTEVMILFLIAGALSLLVLKGGFAASDWLRLNEIPWSSKWQIDQASMLNTLAVVFVFAIITGIFPIVGLLRRDLMGSIAGSGGKSTASRSKHRIHASFVILQVSLSIILLVVSGILVRNLYVTLQKDVGFEIEGRLSVNVPQPEYRFKNGKEGYVEDVLPYQQNILEQIRSVPGVISASAANRAPISTSNMGHSNFSMHHYEYAEGERHANCLRIMTLPGYFETVGTSLLLGRDFEDTDTMDTEGVVIISQNLMERYYDGLNPVGMSIRFWGSDLKIVGVAEQVQDKPYFLEFDRYTLYFPFKQWHAMSRHSTHYMVHVAGEPEKFIPTIERKIKTFDPKAHLDSRTFMENFKIATFAQELPMIVTLFFAIIALFLCGIGLYGLVSFIVAERTKEFGIRMALGANRRIIRNIVFGGSGKLIAWGLLSGLGISLLLASRMQGFFPEVNPYDPTILASVVSFVFVISTIASYMPASRATRINIVETLQA